MKEFMRVLVPNAGALSDALEIARTKLANEDTQIARSQISAAAHVLPSNYDAANERGILIELLAELDARRRGIWQE